MNVGSELVQSGDGRASQSFFEFFREVPLSARAQTALDRLHSSSAWCHLTLSEYVRDPERVHAALQRLGNVGRGTVRELHAAAMSHCHRSTEAKSDRPLLRAIREFDLSARSLTAVKHLQSSQQWDNLTIMGYLQAPDRMRAALARLPNVGRTTMREIHATAVSLLFDMRGGSLGVYQDGDGNGPAEIAARIPFFPAIESYSLPSPLAKRVRTAAREENKGRTLLDFIENTDGFRAQVLGEVGHGLIEVTVEVLKDALRRHLPHKLALEIAESTARRPYRLQSRSTVKSARPTLHPTCSPAETVLDLLQGLSARQREVLQRRYGIGDGNGETLEEVAQHYGVTRERIRQIEKQALGTLSRSRMLADSVAVAWPTLWTRAGGSPLALLIEDIPAARKALGGPTLLALEAVHESLEGWLHRFAVPSAVGWFPSPQAADEFHRGVAALSERVALQSLPAPMSVLFGREQIDKRSAVTLVRAVGRRVYLDYVSDGTLGSRKRRTIRTHRMLAGRTSAIALHDLLNEYHKCYADDQCSGRDALVVMTAAPHLFLTVMEDRWLALGSHADDLDEARVEMLVVDMLASVQHVEGLNEDIDEEQAQAGTNASIASTVERILQKQGPLRYVDLRQRLFDLVGDEVAPASFGPTLLTAGRFTRLAPGLYALPRMSLR
jgi:RNA polymerase sigma factor (sigma-70 family)